MTTVKGAVQALAAGRMTEAQASKVIAAQATRLPKKVDPKKIGTSMVTGDDDASDNDFLHVQVAKDLGKITPEQYETIVNGM